MQFKQNYDVMVECWMLGNENVCDFRAFTNRQENYTGKECKPRIFYCRDALVRKFTVNHRYLSIYAVHYYDTLFLLTYHKYSSVSTLKTFFPSVYA